MTDRKTGRYRLAARQAGSQIERQIDKQREWRPGLLYDETDITDDLVSVVARPPSRPTSNKAFILNI
jgi:hypothetical protein